MFEHIDPYAGDPILTLNETFGRDPRPHKINRIFIPIEP